jgi:hypothetical protein
MAVLGASGIGVRAVYVLDVGPLVDEKCLIAILEPRQVAQPRQIRRHRTASTRDRYLYTEKSVQSLRVLGL